jgi:flavodoxin
MASARSLSHRTLLRCALATAGTSLAASATGCSTSRAPRAETSASTPGQSQGLPETATSSVPGSRALLVYFSRAGENYYYGDRINLRVGNTAVIAAMITELVGLDVYEIEAADPYPEDYEATVQRNVREQEADVRPAISGVLPQLVRYDFVLLGSGVWNVRAPMIMRTFVESFDFTGKTVLPFVTHAVSGMGRVADEYAELCAGARMGDGLAVRGEEADRARPEVEEWLRRIGLLRG